ncbi:MAG: xanthine dehydrogenase family protein molybdopterin-binding subunit [Gammaproteobacteria bacterium]|nr:xanthine dehydrogenase family protein molybdopterin-binding subunit [Gammaproteobacteria bacterium]MCP4089580.1 xanthine dehydrogenase family protein molybdopterin-binding subunit [Gammaproteobacteria bacterium]MCP4278085.1 xanthine dehydrogenase family protein molybdopterin-binding subunit [Gammaproteobacteria bacterium]MCP4832471.1 xanthine dehydrogenase family protein molybdopterin-binding subunit [Gammaproteobacteria bacterium]MCP4930163.1 xanthine dehydrogenase family protein molybdopte
MSAAANKSASRRFSRRRLLLGTVAVAGGGIALTWLTRVPDSLRDSTDVLEPNAFLQITPDGQFIFQLDRVEMGQGTMTGLTTLVAEELDVDPARFDVRFAPVLPTFQRPIQMTGQSRSMIDSWDVLRKTGAAARHMLLEEAAGRWGISKAELRTTDGVVLHPDNKQTVTYAELAAGAALRTPPWSPQLKDPADYLWIGKHVPRLDAHDKVTGAAIFGMDVQLENMLTAVVARCPEIGGELTNVDAVKAASMPGVRGIVELPHGRGIAVVADNFWSAKQAAGTITLGWNGGPLKASTDKTILAEQRRLLDAGAIAYETGSGGNLLDAFSAAATELEAEYTTPYLVHAPMEPMNATAYVSEDHCQVWAPTQAPDIARQVACDILGLTRDQVQVHTTYLGGGFGRRVMWDFIEEAVWTAREFDVPVKLVWTREDDIQHGYFRQQTVHRMRGGLDQDGVTTAWEHKQVAAPTGELLTPPTMSTILPESLSTESRQGIGRWLGKKTVDWMGAFQAREGAVDLLYDIPSTRFAQVAYDPGMPVSIWRSVGNSYNAFVVESFIDELAYAADEDPLWFRYGRLQQHPRHQTVLEQLGQFSGWRSAINQGSQGVALFESFGSVVGQVADVSVDDAGVINVHKVTCVVDCGIAVNPDIVKQQMESAIIFGLTAALYGEINIDRGKVTQSNFHDYRMLKMADAPVIDVHILPSELDPVGVGEPGTPVIAPAVANAVYAATGQRLRSLPLSLSDQA